MLGFKSYKTGPVVLRSASNSYALTSPKKHSYRNVFSIIMVLAVVLLPVLGFLGFSNLSSLQSASAASLCYVKQLDTAATTSSTGPVYKKVDANCNADGAYYYSNDKAASTGDAGGAADQKCYIEVYSNSGLNGKQDADCSAVGARYYSNNAPASSGVYDSDVTVGAGGTGGLQLGTVNSGSELIDACGNPKQPKDGEYPLLTMWPNPSPGGPEINNNLSPIGDIASGDAKALPGGDSYVSTLRADSQSYTAYEWYKYTGLQWQNYSYEQQGGCAIGLDTLNAIPNMLLTLNTSLSDITISVIGWVTTADIVSILFFGDGAGGNQDSVLSSLIINLKDAFFLTYLAPIVFLSTLWLAWRGLVKRQSRDAIQGVIWMFAASAAALTFMTNPTWFAQGANKAVFDISSSLINLSAGTTTAGNESGLCRLPAGATDRSVRTIQCALWSNFTYQPWVAGQIGSGGNQDIVLTDSGIDTTFDAGENKIGLVLLDAKVYNRLDALKADQAGTPANWTPPEAYKEHKRTQWKALAANTTGSYKASVYPFYSGQDASSRWNVGITAIVGQIVAFIPLLVLGFTMIGQQVIFIFLLVMAPLFLTIGIHPGYGRRMALGWLEMTLATLIKRLAAAALIGVLLAYYGAVLNTTVDAWPVIGFLGSIIMIAVGSVAVLIFRGKILKQAGDLINLDGQQVAKGGLKNFMSGAGAVLAGGVGVGLAESKNGGSFSKGLVKGGMNNYNGPMPAGTGLVRQGISDHKSHNMKEAQKKLIKRQLGEFDEKDRMAQENAGTSEVTPAFEEKQSLDNPVSPERSSQYRDSRPRLNTPSDRPRPANENESAAWAKAWEPVEKRLYTDQWKAKESMMRQHESKISEMRNSRIEIPESAFSETQRKFDKEISTLEKRFNEEWSSVFKEQDSWLTQLRTANKETTV